MENDGRTAPFILRVKAWLLVLPTIQPAARTISRPCFFGLARQDFSDVVNGHRKHETRNAAKEHTYAH
jgi:hypothetical protein